MTELFKNIISTIIGVFVGVISSFAAWWIIFHLNIANIKFSPNLCKDRLEADNSGFRYRIKIQNFGRRAILDLELIAKYRVVGLRKNRPANWETVYIPLHLNRILKVSPYKNGQKSYIIKLCINEVNDFNNNLYPTEIIEKSKTKTILLEDLLNLGTKCTLQIYGFGYDEFTGIRKLYKSKIYSLSDIQTGIFKKNSLDVIPYKKAEETEEEEY